MQRSRTRLFEEPDHDVGVLRDQFGPIPVAGFFAMGEIGPVGGQNFVHGYTASVVLFEEAEPISLERQGKPSLHKSRDGGEHASPILRSCPALLAVIADRKANPTRTSDLMSISLLNGGTSKIGARRSPRRPVSLSRSRRFEPGEARSIAHLVHEVARPFAVHTLVLLGLKDIPWKPTSRPRLARRASASAGSSRKVHEVADLLFHTLVLLGSRTFHGRDRGNWPGGSA